MDPHARSIEGESDETSHKAGKRPVLAGVHVREEDLEPQQGLHIASRVFRVASVLILLLAIGQFGVWWMDRPPENIGLGLLIGDTVRLVVFSALLWAAGDLATIVIKTHYDMRAARILLARQTYMMREMGTTSGSLHEPEPEGERRVGD